jgi:CRP-like cAMP-binding protein
VSSSLEHIKALMCEVPQFDQLDNDELDILGRNVSYRRVPQGMVLCREGTVGDALFYVVDGKIEIKKESMDGRQTVLAQFNKGSTVGEMSLIEESARSATAVAMEDVELLILTRDHFEKIIEQYPYIGLKILRNIAKSLSNRLRHTSGRFADVFK